MQRAEAVYRFGMRILTTLALCTLIAAPARADCVVLLHGLARSEYSLWLMEQVLETHGFRVVNRSYPSESAPIADLVAHVGRSVGECGAERTHFVTHSLGGILARIWLQDNRPADMGRVVMLAPPNHGTAIVDTLAAQSVVSDLMTRLSGPAALELGTGANSVPAQLGPVDFELGVIAGNRAFSPLGPILLDGPNDGTVTIDSTRVAGMADHIVLPTSHSLMMVNPLVIAEVLSFLKRGAFDHEISLGSAVQQLIEP